MSGFHLRDQFDRDDDHGIDGAATADESATRPSTTASKKKRNLPGNPDPDAEVMALSPRTLMATNRYICEVCHKGFQREQNLQLHRRGHNLPWKLKQRPTAQVKKRVYVCPELNCVHHDPGRALGDLTGIKKHYCRKHGEKKWKCDKCSKRYAVQSDWKAHTKICGTREYRCDCGTIFSRKDSFVTHRAFCDAFTEDNNHKTNHAHEIIHLPVSADTQGMMMMMMPAAGNLNSDPIIDPRTASSPPPATGSALTSATALLQKAAEMGARISDNSIAPILLKGFAGYSTSTIMNYSSSSIAADEEFAFTNPGSLYMVNCNNPEAYNRRSSDENSNGGYTVDFLGVAPSVAHSSLERKKMVGLEYSKSQHSLHSEW